MPYPLVRRSAIPGVVSGESRILQVGAGVDARPVPVPHLGIDACQPGAKVDTGCLIRDGGCRAHDQGQARPAPSAARLPMWPRGMTRTGGDPELGGQCPPLGPAGHTGKAPRLRMPWDIQEAGRFVGRGRGCRLTGLSDTAYSRFNDIAYSEATVVQLPAHTDLIDQINAVTTTADLATLLAGITHLDRPGFPGDLADGNYFDGFFFATFEGGRRAMTQIHQLAPHVLTIWGELDADQRDADYAAKDAARAEIDAARGRGRPEIGRLVQIRMPDWMIRLVDRYADEHDMKRAEAARHLIAAGHRAVTQTTVR